MKNVCRLHLCQKIWKKLHAKVGHLFVKYPNLPIEYTDEDKAKSGTTLKRKFYHLGSSAYICYLEPFQSTIQFIKVKTNLQVLVLILFAGIQLIAQDSPRLSGSLQANGNIFIKDTVIGAANIPQYERQFFGGESWMALNYSNWGFDVGIRYDLFNNSNILNPTDSYTAQGIGRWYISKTINKLSITAGYIYDQIGSGMIFRAWEDRPLLIDNALQGLRLSYEITPDITIKGFSGKQKNLFETYGSVISGINIDGFFSFGESGNVSISPGFGMVHKNMDDRTLSNIINVLSTYHPNDSIGAKYNTYAYTVYNTLNMGNLSWYIEGAFKSREVFFDPLAERTLFSGGTTLGKFVFEPGNIVYTSLSYAAEGFGITVEGKRTENFTFRADPFVALNRGLINFLPPMAKLHTYRLKSRYIAATQELSEQAVQVEARYAPNDTWTFGLAFSNITSLENLLLYRDLDFEFNYKANNDLHFLWGLQIQRYNQEIYEEKPDVPIVETLIPYVEILYKLDRRKSLRFEAQYMYIGQDEKAGFRQDYGQWLFGQLEFSIAPRWTITVADMFNFDPGKNSPTDANGEKLSVHYPRFDVFFNHKSNRYSLSYVKQVEGVVCTGGICRLEPAFNGVRFTVSSTF
jgi:hypothetical protein